MTESVPELPSGSSKPAKPRFTWPTPVEWLVCGLILAVTIGLLVSPVKHSGNSHFRGYCVNNLKVIGFALHSYHDKYDCFPPAFVADDQGRPIHSWRVLILPFLDKQQLYDKYRFDESWDGPHNRELANEVVDVFHCPADRHSDTKEPLPTTSYVAVIGPETAWDGKLPRKQSDIGDGLEQTLLVVEMAHSGINWMEPRDLEMSRLAPTINSKSQPGISSNHKAGVEVLFADGHTRFLSETLPANTLRALLTRSGGETVGEY